MNPVGVAAWSTIAVCTVAFALNLSTSPVRDQWLTRLGWAAGVGVTVTIVLTFNPRTWQELVGFTEIVAGVLLLVLVVAGLIAAVAREDVLWELRRWWDWRRFDREAKRLARSERREVGR